MVGRKTEKKRLRWIIGKIQTKLRLIHHWLILEQVEKINQMLRGHYNYDGMAGILKSLYKVYQAADKYWHKMLGSRSRKGYVTWERYAQIKSWFPIVRPRISIPYKELKLYVIDSVNPFLKSTVREICTPGSVGFGPPIGWPLYPETGVSHPLLLDHLLGDVMMMTTLDYVRNFRYV
ncbi:hypothetical protein GCM10010965_23490 [Caldalkalibacillus thermarum]|uniref:hypothetical protein n=1 Tax=Caldalkalibacillus thermarum TaxID=296745 RepID=UPI001662D0B6|nr:hypothetical protein [Caldalkalibacillus thermarum]GGK29929.1 hypothetical protein GCM10010965_23490 [Caldalkalibacillus thermarum]